MSSVPPWLLTTTPLRPRNTPPFTFRGSIFARNPLSAGMASIAPSIAKGPDLNASFSMSEIIRAMPSAVLPPARCVASSFARKGLALRSRSASVASVFSCCASARRPLALQVGTAAGTASIVALCVWALLLRGRSSLGRSRSLLLPVSIGAVPAILFWKVFWSMQFSGGLDEWPMRPGFLPLPSERCGTRRARGIARARVAGVAFNPSQRFLNVNGLWWSRRPAAAPCAPQCRRVGLTTILSHGIPNHPESEAFRTIRFKDLGLSPVPSDGSASRRGRRV